MSELVPSEICLHQASRTLDLVYPDGTKYTLGCEYLRVYSPSAEVRGHGTGQETLQTGKRMVSITSIEAVGNYALQLHFSDGHNSGIYSWQYLHELCRERDQRWTCLLYTSPSPRDRTRSRMPSSA